jgi:hypothetical protein
LEALWFDTRHRLRKDVSIQNARSRGRHTSHNVNITSIVQKWTKTLICLFTFVNFWKVRKTEKSGRPQGVCIIERDKNQARSLSGIWENGSVVDQGTNPSHDELWAFLCSQDATASQDSGRKSCLIGYLAKAAGENKIDQNSVIADLIEEFGNGILILLTSGAAAR